MDVSARMWITTVPLLDADDPVVLLGLDHTSESPGERVISLLLDRGHEGEEGVFHLLPFDLSARYERIGDRLAVAVTTSCQVLAHALADRPDLAGAYLPHLPAGAADMDRVTLLRREIVTGFVPAEQGGEKQPVLLVDDDGSAPVAELLARFEDGEAGLAVLHAD
ncbi:hypothetical protein OG705_03570 [Streptomyces sp. NBC_00838]|uniref:hypothetical protein n=1 Tax=Streptomyces sp. NBC_00838 TaxID=2903680 RepID=UPI00386E08EC|nr:hypothetical protein OG705_03570 [Streptomyces sp. NBC_00838]